MSNLSDFVIQDGDLKQYTGPSGDVVIPDGVTGIWSGAFKNCTSLTSIVIPESVTSIGSFAFAHCTNLSGITLPDSVTSIGENAFLETAYCKEEQNWDQGVLYIGNHLIQANFKKVVKNYIVRDGTVCIADQAFEKCTKLLAIKLPQSLRAIGLSAFRLCKKLTEIEIPGSCASTGWGSFEKCTELRSVILGEGVKEIADSTFFGCAALSHIQIPNSVKAIGNNAFNGCKSLEDLVLPEDVETIDSSAFGDCTALKHVFLTKAVMDTIDAKWFRSRFNNVDLNFLWLEENINFDSRVAELCKKSILRKKDEYAAKIFENDSASAMVNFLALLGKIEIDSLDGYITIGTEKAATAVTAFLLDYKAKHFTATDADQAMEAKIEKELGFKAYTVADYRKLFKFTISEGKATITAYKGHESSITIPAMIGKNKVVGFTLCDYSTQKVYKEEVQNKLTNVVIEDGVEMIGEDAFLKCHALQSVSIPDSVTAIGSSAFSQCANLQSIELPSGVTTVGSYAFSDCKSLTSVVLPDGMTSIDEGLFRGCDNLTEIVIPDSITTIWYRAFSGCGNLNKIAIPTGVKHLESDAFYNTGYYNNGANWEDGLLYIGNRLIAANRNDGSECYTIKDGTEYVSSRAFYLCGSLTNIKIPDSVTNISGYAFDSCTKLTDIVLPNSITKIHMGTFRECKSLTHIVLPERVACIEAWAFQDCNGLTSITIPSSVTSIDKLAFLRCDHVVIHAPAGSYAETYAKENDIPFVAE